jgi:DNA (cytosine-5)-methyltransferase 1
MRKIKAADLFCGAGGTSTGLAEACASLGYELDLLAVNHWDIAIATHSQNHPDAQHLCASLDSVDPRKLVPSGKLDLLVASPECTHHSIARGGKPVNDQSRASAWRIVEWASQIRIQHILIENVKEFRTWGPLGSNGRPLKSRKGETYFAFLNALRALGYIVEERILNAADYGDPTSRERLFVQARLGRKGIGWPESTHAPANAIAGEASQPALFAHKTQRAPYRTAREIIDWSIPGESIFTRKRPLAPNTLNRIYKGLQKFSGIPFIIPAGGPEISARSVNQPLNTILTRDHVGIVQPYLVKFFGGHDGHSIDEPLPTITANYEHYGLAQPFIVELRGNQDARSLDEPVSTVTGSGAHHALCQPFLTRFQGGRDCDQRNYSLEEPIRTLDTSNRFGLCQPFIVGAGGPSYAGKPRSVDKPFNTVLTNDHSALVQPFIIPVNHGRDERSHSLNSPMPTITSVDAWALIQSYLVKYNGTGQAQPVDEPLDTVTAKDRFGLCEPQLSEVGGYFLLDIRFRMLQPHELAAAMSFPKSYSFAGNREQRVKQIGNAVPVGLARALCQAILAA